MTEPGLQPSELELEELPLPYRFDVQALEQIRLAPLLEHIERVGVGDLFGTMITPNAAASILMDEAKTSYPSQPPHKHMQSGEPAA